MKLSKTLFTAVLFGAIASLTTGCGGDEKCTCEALGASVCVDSDDSDDFDGDACEDAGCTLEDGLCDD